MQQVAINARATSAKLASLSAGSPADPCPRCASPNGSFSAQFLAGLLLLHQSADFRMRDSSVHTGSAVTIRAAEEQTFDPQLVLDGVGPC